MQGIYEWEVTRPDGSVLVYIGQAVNIAARKRKYLDDWRGYGPTTNIHLKRAVLKYGETAAKHRVLEEVEWVEDLTERERFWFWKRVEELGRANVANELEPGTNPMNDPQVAGRHAQRGRQQLAALREQPDVEARRKQRAVEGKRAAWAERSPMFMSPTGDIVSASHGLRALCEEYGLSQGNMSQVAAGVRTQHKGWTLYKP